MGGGGGKGGGGGGWDPVSGNLQSGYAAFKPGQTAAGSTHPYFGGTVDPGHPDFQYYQAGWDRAQADYQKQMEEQAMYQEMLGGLMGAQEEAARAAEEAQRRASYMNVLANPSARFGDVTGALQGIGADASDFGYVWDPSQSYDDISGAWRPMTEDEFNTMGEDRATAVDQYRGIRTADDTDWYDTWTKALEGEAQRDDAYGGYLDAANTAIDYVNEQIGREQSNANLLGIDYNITDESKQERINNYFASVWSESDQSSLQDLMNQWGNPEGFEDWIAVRGETPTNMTDTTPNRTGTSGGMTPTKKPGNILADDDILGQQVLLGG
jgi:hypothetical protein